MPWEAGEDRTGKTFEIAIGPMLDRLEQGR
jgi:hypothetical protein